MGAKEQRLEWIDALRGMAFLLVIISHSVSIPVINHGINSFHMPLFFVISGLCINPEKIAKRSIFTEVRGKIQSLLIPYFWIQFSLFPILVWRCKIYTHSLIKLTDVVKGIFVSQNVWYTAVTNPTWFLGAIFFASLYSTIIFKIIKKNELLRAVAFACVMGLGFYLKDLTMAYHINTGLVGAGFIYIGYGFKKYVLDNHQVFSNGKQKFSLSLILLMMGLVAGFSNQMGGMVYGGYGEITKFLASSILGSLAFVVLFYKQNVDKFLVFIGQNTIYNLGFHMLIVNVLKVVHPLVRNDVAGYLGRAFVMCFCLWPIILLINKFWPYMNGKRSEYNTSYKSFLLKYIMVAWCAMVPMYIAANDVLHIISGHGKAELACVLAADLVVSFVFTLITYKWVPFIYLERKAKKVQVEQQA